MSICIPTSKREMKHAPPQKKRNTPRASPAPSLRRGLQPEPGLREPVCGITACLADPCPWAGPFTSVRWGERAPCLGGRVGINELSTSVRLPRGPGPQ